MALLCFISDLIFKTLVEKYKLAAEEELSKTVLWVPVDSSFDIQKGQNDWNTNYGVSSWSKDMRVTGKVLGEVIWPEVLARFFCSVLQFAHGYNAFAAKLREQASNIRRDPDK